MKNNLKAVDFLIAKKSIIYGFLASLVLLVVYFSVLTFVSGWSFALAQFSRYWYFIVSLSLGFGIQIALFTYLKNAVGNMGGSAKVAAVSGTASTAAMISCCSHYLVNLLPIIGITGFVTIVSQYQVQLFYVGLAFNFLGIVYMLKKLNNFLKGAAKVQI
ncbi:MAG: hypothetical protein A2860_00070 [Candidatus Levybacteria bacterium RIFCSPHIGHO2_01_FULL_37_33]|nr:MAG: hypothetical protein A2860_00070 [Candidatus Levybacteria bacterium RIFCSPHIGHO2_01_FULL_37_33]OGH16965.1 MAG: hypothetical protein A3C97_03660 [Candidatus Levybacteria bacterium RIFCSPHIGHO2_02_FULL_37_11]OGH29198.1 MAG: hypothetical protein A3F30_04350 [Candidatus Levybacteria bacterium RIFCSPHIGHO2_12_FULL_37_12]OGH33201.1 MAG: hypothetical protein A2953_02980 [Candidatus Levybacteria bacterium RIFCSPLOWO2_01_FULL_36_54]